MSEDFTDYYDEVPPSTLGQRLMARLFGKRIDVRIGGKTLIIKEWRGGHYLIGLKGVPDPDQAS